MALVQNIAGPQIGATLPTPYSEAQSLYAGILKVLGPAAMATPEGAIIMAIQQGINLLPPGGLKKWLGIVTNPFAFMQAIKTLITGRTYTTGQYRLAERYIDQVLSPNGPNSITSYRDVTDDMVPAAVTFFTVVFGVRITTDEDLWALNDGAAAYRARPGVDYKGMGDITDAALQRAVYLTQTFYPSSTFNVSTWDLDHFSAYPLASPIPDPWVFGKLYSGPLPGGGNAVNGVIEVKDTMSTAAPTPGATEGDGSTGKDNTLLWIGGALLAAGLYFGTRKKRKKSIYGLG